MEKIWRIIHKISLLTLLIWSSSYQEPKNCSHLHMLKTQSEFLSVILIHKIFPDECNMQDDNIGEVATKALGFSPCGMNEQGTVIKCKKDG